ncbi:MAG TPA: helix-turn-helix domain-containing protein [Rhizomicrobium sp.]|jgi:AraC-like DNA-binding protein
MKAFSAMLEGAEISLRRCCPQLRPYVGCFWTIEARRGGRVRSVPDGCTSIDFTFRASQLPIANFTGPSTAPRERLFEDERIVGVRLNPGVAHLLLRRPIHELLDRRVAIASVVADAPLADAVLSPDDHIDRMELWLIGHLSGANIEPTVARCIARIAGRGGDIRVEPLARELGVSARHLNRLFRKWTGYSVKSLARVARFQNVLDGFDNADAPGAAAVAAENGFFDQAHLSRDVTHFARDTPTRLISGRVADFSKTRCDDLS